MVIVKMDEFAKVMLGSQQSIRSQLREVHATRITNNHQK